jgi:peptide/nickel transport system permease protein
MRKRLSNINRWGLIGHMILAVFVLGTLLAPFIAPHDPWVRTQPMLRPTTEHLLGTNDIGQDILSELIYGARISLLVGFAAALLATVLGIVIGIIAGFSKGLMENVLMGISDIFLVIPALPLIILFAVYLGPNLWNIIVIIGILSWPSTARVIRSQALSIRESGYVESSRALGANELWLMWCHVLPNLIPIIMAKFVLTVAFALLTEASLSFIGLGDSVAKSWGMTLHYAFGRGGFIRGLWWWYLPPGLCIALCILALMLISFSIEGMSDPRLKRMLER